MPMAIFNACIIAEVELYISSSMLRHVQHVDLSILKNRKKTTQTFTLGNLWVCKTL